MPLSAQGLLLRMPAGAGTRLASLRESGVAHAADAGFDLEPLFEVAAAERDRGINGVPAREWFVARPKGTAMTAGDGWLAAYDLMARSAGFAAVGTGPDLIEPDFLQDWGDRSEHAGLGAAGGFDDQSTAGGAAVVPNAFAWHLNDSYSQLRAARGRAVNGRPVRIAHLDVGYDPNHDTYPATRVDLRAQKNLLDGGNLIDDARDRGVTGMLKNPGHGTGTLGILAGERFAFNDDGYQFDDVIGGDPYARIIPVRVGNSVVQIKTSSVAQGIAYAAGRLKDFPSDPVDVISMSMGGLASAAWADATNDAYEAGVLFVAAAGNNFGGLPTRFVVFPARFGRVLAACGVMADGRPYYGLTDRVMQGCWGPAKKMATAMAAFTPNTPWAEKDGPKIVDMNGAGTSSATPQIAAAAALYLRLHGDVLFDAGRYPQPWMRVEAVRAALFASAAAANDMEKIGRGTLRAADALGHAPLAVEELRKMPRDSAAFAFLRALSGLGASASAIDGMLRLEATQLLQRWDGPGPNPLEAAVADPDADGPLVSAGQVRQFIEALEQHPHASPQLRKRANETLSALGASVPRPPRPMPPTSDGDASTQPTTSAVPPVDPGQPVLPPPPYRALRGYALDPSLSQSLATAGEGEMLFKLPWENLEPGPRGEYVDVVDIDPGSGCFYEPVDLDAPYLLAQNGLAPSEGTPQFHQQMVYAASMATIANFEYALGRRALWRPGPSPVAENPKNDSKYVQRLRIYPHALREDNAYYAPDKVALLFGYFNARADDPGDHLPGGRVFACLSHDIVAHETTHALLDGMHRRFLLPSNPDVLAFHEAFADIVALLQHFTFPEVLRREIAGTRGDIRQQDSLLGKLAVQFGRGRGGGQALRDAIGTIDDNGEWTPRKPDPSAYNDDNTEPHERGVILVAAVFDAFLSIYGRRTADLYRLATGGSGVLRPGAIHPDLVNRLAAEAAKSAQHVLTMCIRALDYCPPTDITFGEYLRAILTADYDVLKNDAMNYRVAFVEAFRRRGIYPRDLRTLDVESLLWRSPATDVPARPNLLQGVLKKVQAFAGSQLYAVDRKTIFFQQRRTRAALHGLLLDWFYRSLDGAADAKSLGLLLPEKRQRGQKLFEVHSVRVAHRAGPDGFVSPRLMIGLLQERQAPVTPGSNGDKMTFEGGATIVADLRERRVLYGIRKHVASPGRLARQQAFAAAGGDLLRETYLGPGALQSEHAYAEQLALVHRAATRRGD